MVAVAGVPVVLAVVAAVVTFAVAHGRGSMIQVPAPDSGDMLITLLPSADGS